MAKPQNRKLGSAKGLNFGKMNRVGGLLVEANKAEEPFQFKKFLTRLFASTGFNIVMAILTFYTIFIIDINQAFMATGTATTVSVIHCIAMTCYAIEVALLAYSSEGYACSFYFWVDMISTFTMILELVWVEDLMSSSGDVRAALSLAKVTKASRLSKVGAKSSKIMKFIRLLKLMRAVVKPVVKKQQNQEQVKLPEGEQLPADETQAGLMKDGEILTISPKEAETYSAHRQMLQSILIRLQQGRRDLDRRKSRDLNIGNIILDFGIKRHHQQQMNIIEAIQKTIQLPPLERPKVDPIKRLEMDQRWLETAENKKSKNNASEGLKEQDTKVGEILKYQIQKNIIIMVLGLIILLPMISADTWYDQDGTATGTPTVFIPFLNGTSNREVECILHTFIESSAELNPPLVFLRADTGSQVFTYPGSFPDLEERFQPVKLESLRTGEITRIVQDNVQIVFSNQKNYRFIAVLNCVRSFFITLVLIFSTVLFMNDIEKYALDPLDKMRKSISEISNKPFQALKRIASNRFSSKVTDEAVQQDTGEEDELASLNLETKILEEVIMRVTTLVTIGIGELGPETITNRLTVVDSTTQSSSPPLCEDAKGIAAVMLYVRLGFHRKLCRKLTERPSQSKQDKVIDRTEGSEEKPIKSHDHLSDRLISIVNQIFFLIHEIGVTSGAVPIENDTDGVLLIWRSEDLKNIIEMNFGMKPPNLESKIGARLKQLFELASLCFFKISQTIHRVIYSSTNRLSDNSLDLNSSDINRFRQIFVFGGLHAGIATEGCVGSSFKSDARCLGVNVNVTKAMSGLAEEYGVRCLCSGLFWSLLTDQTKLQYRKIDKINYANSYKCDVYCNDFDIVPDDNSGEEKLWSMLKLNAELESSVVNSFVLAAYKKREELYERLKHERPIDILKLQKKLLESKFAYNEEFLETWDQAIQRYYDGDWQRALPLLETSMLNDDQPTVLLRRKIKAYGGFMPDNWTFTRQYDTI